MSKVVNNPNRFGLHGKWVNVVTELGSEIWNNASSSRNGGMMAGVKVTHDGHHLGVIFPDGRWRTSRGNPYVDPAEEPHTLEKAGEKYAILYESTRNSKFPHGNLLVLKQIEKPDVEYNYCPNCGEVLQ